MADIKAMLAVQPQYMLFALLKEQTDKSKIDPLNSDQWTFYVVPTKKALKIEDAVSIPSHFILWKSRKKI